MAGRFINPLPQFSDSTPTMYAGAKLFFYATGTSTKLNTYTTKALSIANSNPIVLDSSGRIPSDIFLQDLEYSVVLAPSTDTDPPTSPIWTADPVSHRDSSLVAKTLTGSGAPTGVVAGTAGSASILPDFYWDYTNFILYVCQVTGTSGTAVWTAVNASASTPAVPPPQGRLTLTSATPVLATNAVAATAVYYTPFIGNLVPIYNGTSMTPTEFSELTLTLAASHTASSIYDVFVFSNSGVLTIATGPSWTTVTAGSSARGSGAGTTQIARVKGLWTNAVAMTGRNGATTYSIGANLATYVGSIYMDASNGQVSCLQSYGQSRKWGVWNAYNRVPIIMKGGDPTASWDYRTATIREQRGQVGTNRITVFTGLAEEYFDARLKGRVAMTLDAAGAAASADAGIGWDSITAYSGTTSTIAQSLPANGVTSENYLAEFMSAPILGISNVNILERGAAAATVCNFIGTETGTSLTVRYQG